MGDWYPERKLRVAVHFFEMLIEQQFFQKAVKYKAMHDGFFFQIEAENAWLPRALAKFCFLRIVLNRAII